MITVYNPFGLDYYDRLDRERAELDDLELAEFLNEIEHDDFNRRIYHDTDRFGNRIRYFYDRNGCEIYIDDDGSYYGIDDKTGRSYEITEDEVEAIA